MTDEIVLFHNPMSRGGAIHWMLEELGVPYRLEVLDFEKKQHKTPAYLAINPMGKIPAILHRGVVVTEVAAILTYLADAFPEANLAPKIGDPARGTYLRWMFFAAGCVEPAVLDHMLKRTPPERTSAVGWGTYEDTMSTLEKALTPGPYVLGETFSAVDLYLGAQLGFGLRTKAIEPRPAFIPFMAHIRERPAFHRMHEKGAVLIEQLKR
jgi:glutathione S-transferase